MVQSLFNPGKEDHGVECGRQVAVLALLETENNRFILTCTCSIKAYARLVDSGRSSSLPSGEMAHEQILVLLCSLTMVWGQVRVQRYG